MMPRLTRPDFWLLGAVGGLLGFGIVMVLNVSYFQAGVRYHDPYLFFRKHLVSVLGGVGVMLLNRDGAVFAGRRLGLGRQLVDELFQEIESRLHRFPAVDPARFRRRLDDALRDKG